MRAGLVGTLAGTILQVQTAPICKELRVECVYLQDCLHGTWFPKLRQFKKKSQICKNYKDKHKNTKDF